MIKPPVANLLLIASSIGEAFLVDIRRAPGAAMKRLNTILSSRDPGSIFEAMDLAERIAFVDPSFKERRDEIFRTAIKEFKKTGRTIQANLASVRLAGGTLEGEMEPDPWGDSPERADRIEKNGALANAAAMLSRLGDEDGAARLYRRHLESARDPRSVSDVIEEIIRFSIRSSKHSNLYDDLFRAVGRVAAKRIPGIPAATAVAGDDDPSAVIPPSIEVFTERPAPLAIAFAGLESERNILKEREPVERIHMRNHLFAGIKAAAEDPIPRIASAIIEEAVLAGAELDEESLSTLLTALEGRGEISAAARIVRAAGWPECADEYHRINRLFSITGLPLARPTTFMRIREETERMLANLPAVRPAMRPSRTDLLASGGSWASIRSGAGLEDEESVEFVYDIVPQSI